MIVKVTIGAAASVCLVVLLSGCYYIRQGVQLIRYTASGVPNTRILSDPDTDLEVRKFLDLVEQINHFGRVELGLKTGRNYTRFAEIGRSHLAYVVSATESFSFTPYLWRYPIVGSMPYRGFFSMEEARREADKMEAPGGLDAWVRGVGAFSTLGFLSDPLYSYMLRYPVHSLANMILHEQAHATLFIRGEGVFNEQFATFVGDEGSRLFLKRVYGEDSPEYRRMLDSRHDQEVFRKIIFSLRDELEVLYSSLYDPSDAPDFDPQQLKEQIIAWHQEEFARNYDELFQTDAYRGFSELSINNAYIGLFVLYGDNLEAFYQLYERLYRDMKSVITHLSDLGRAAPAFISQSAAL